MNPTRSQLDPEGHPGTAGEASASAVEPETGTAALPSAGVNSDPWNIAVLRVQALAARLPALPAPADVAAPEPAAGPAAELEAAPEEEQDTSSADLLANDSLGG